MTVARVLIIVCGAAALIAAPAALAALLIWFGGSQYLGPGRALRDFM
jgi:hypothetical protein